MKEILKKINIKRLLQYWLFMFLSLVAQNMLFTQLRPLGVCPLVLPAVAVAVGMFEGAVWGAVFSLVLGYFADMAFIENTIAFTVLFPALSFLAGFVAQFFINRRFFAYMGAAFIGILITGIFQMLKTVAMDVWSGSMITTVILQTLWSLPFAALAYFPAAEWIE